MYISDEDWEVGKVVKYLKPNHVGEDIYLRPDGKIDRDEDKIIKAQRIFKHNWYRPGGPGSRKSLERLISLANWSPPNV